MMVINRGFDRFAIIMLTLSLMIGSSLSFGETGLYKRNGKYIILSLVYGGYSKEEGKHLCLVSAYRMSGGPSINSDWYKVERHPKTYRDCASEDEIKDLIDSAYKHYGSL